LTTLFENTKIAQLAKNISEKINIDEWTESMIKTMEGKWFKNIYWKLDVFSCVLVKRNREWFKNAIHHLEDLWKIVCEERITGEYMKRAPKKKNKEKNIQPSIHLQFMNSDIQVDTQNDIQLE
jgi:hypothetical protein